MPAATPTTAPELLTVATPVFDDDHGVIVDGFVVALKLTFDPTQIDDDPVMIGNGFTVTVVVLAHPLLFVYVIVVVPTDKAVTNPLVLTVATDVAELVQGLVTAAVPEPVS